MNKPYLKEILPNNTDAKPTVPLSLAEIADFSSTLVYLMWHARRPSVMDLHTDSKSGKLSLINSFEQTKATADIANMTSVAFKKFCRQMLNATQLSESVVLLSLKYIAILLQNSPNIQGADGSEYRLFTVSLMLANKFLDDNTFTNKTWSEVSGMKVTDLNIMELEFLDVLHFRLDVKKEEYERWRTALYSFRQQLVLVPEIQQKRLAPSQPLSANTFYPSHLFSPSQQKYSVNQGPFARVPLRIPPQPLYYSKTPRVPDTSNPYHRPMTYDEPTATTTTTTTTCSYYYQNNATSSSTLPQVTLKQSNPAYYNPYHNNSTYLA
ncbi:cyclin-domain-containing protein [Sporodiniella umbellata]|nr:cyclin-domain-containing protein [Sporodiniella umbellata]